MRNSTENIYRQKGNLLIDYISANLHKPLQLDVIAARFNVSQRQLIRIMRLSVDEPFVSYIARQRMERAVIYMQLEKLTLTALAGMVGYDNPQSFSKAFKKQFGISPKAYLNQLQMRLKICTRFGRNGVCRFRPEVCQFHDTELVYIRIFGKYGEKVPYETAWSKLVHFMNDNNLLSAGTRFIGISFDDPNVTDAHRCRFYACATLQKAIVPTAEFGSIRISKGRYAVYTLRGSYSGLQEFYNSIDSGFGHEMRHGVTFEEYVNSPYDTKEEDLITRIYIPIK